MQVHIINRMLKTKINLIMVTMDNNGEHSNGNGSDHGSGKGAGGEIIDFSAAMEKKLEREKLEKKWRQEYQDLQNAEKKKEPLLNVPPATKALLAIIIGIHILTQFILSPEQFGWIYTHFSFIPASYTQDTGAPFWVKLVSPVTYLFLHGNWMHVGMNAVMLLAFGTGLEKFIGSTKMVVYFITCGIAAAFAHLMINSGSYNPLIGASGGLNGLFAGVMMIMHHRGQMGNGKYGIWPIIGIWVAITVVFGFVSSPNMLGASADGSAVEIAWIAHLGGFLAGFAFFKPIMRWKI